MAGVNRIFGEMMVRKILKNVLFGILISIVVFSQHSFAEDKFVIVIIDGARYSETFGGPNHTYIPQMWNLRTQGAYSSKFYNDSLTFTSRAIPALWCGSWTDVIDTVYNGSNTQYSVKPSIFEYYRKQKNAPDTDCFYVLKYISSLWLPSFRPDYGPNYWPKFHSVGSTDSDVAAQTQFVINNFHPKFLWVYLADVDKAGHTGNWSNYVGAIQTADGIVGDLWNQLQLDPFYRDSTYMFVTNDHGRHDDQHGGFQGHGCGCDGCRHIMFLALGPGIMQNYVAIPSRRIPDMTATVGEILNINPEYATGNVMTEILKPVPLLNENSAAGIDHFSLSQNYPNPFNSFTNIDFYLPEKGSVNLEVFNNIGEKVETLLWQEMSGGQHQVRFYANNLPSGIYFYRLSSWRQTQLKRMHLIN